MTVALDGSFFRFVPSVADPVAYNGINEFITLWVSYREDEVWK